MNPLSRCTLVVLTGIMCLSFASAQPSGGVPYEAREVSYENTTDKITIAGTLTVPKTGGPFPAVLLVQGGSGAGADRDYVDPFGGKPFRDLADYLSRRGIAVLRVDDRGAGKTTGSKAQSSIDALARDQVAGIAFLKMQANIDPKRVGLLGHSFAGVTVPLAAGMISDLGFVITLSGIAAPLQSRTASNREADWNSTLTNELIVEVQRAALQKLPAAETAAAISGLLSRTKERLSAAERLEFDRLYPDVTAVARARASQLNPLALSALLGDVGLGARSTKAPFLAVYGNGDTTVSPLTNVPAITASLVEARNPDFMVAAISGLERGLEHGLAVCIKRGPNGVCQGGDWSPTALRYIEDWILRH